MPAPDGVLGRCAPALLAASPRPPTHAPYPARAPARVLFPMASAPAAAAAIRAYTTPATAGGGLALGAAAGLARLGATRLAPRPLALGGPGTFLEHLQSLFPERMEFCVHLGPPRANRKPVVHVLTPAGRSVAYVKLGVDAFTDARVRREARALTALGKATTPGLVAPELLSQGTWRGRAYLVMSPLARGRPRVPSGPARERARAGLLEAFPITAHALAEAPWWRGVMDSLHARANDPVGGRLLEAASGVEDRFGDQLHVTGAGHGDWSRWNLRACGTEVAAWDWEKFDPHVPVAWDEMHFRLGRDRRGPGRVFARPPQWLEAIAPGVRAGYLAHRASERLHDQGASGVPNAALLGWVLPALEHTVRSGGGK